VSKRKDIIRVGDMVRVITPEVFVRCGYPLDFKEAREHVDAEMEQSIWDIIKALSTMGDKRRNDRIFKRKPRVYRRILNALTYDYVSLKGFGGNERSIYTRSVPELAGSMRSVCGIRYVKTGTRYAGYGGKSFGFGDYDDYEPPGLANAKTHKLLRIGPVVIIGGELFFPQIYGPKIDSWIEACHVEKLLEDD